MYLREYCKKAQNRIQFRMNGSTAVHNCRALWCAFCNVSYLSSPLQNSFTLKFMLFRIFYILIRERPKHCQGNRFRHVTHHVHVCGTLVLRGVIYCDQWLDKCFPGGQGECMELSQSSSIQLSRLNMPRSVHCISKLN